MEVTCLRCKKTFKTAPSEVKKGKGKYCSMDCYLLQRQRPAKQCPSCSLFFTPNKATRLYCSPACNVSDPTQRFWSQVDKMTTPNGCWTWLGGRTTKGYGKFVVKIEGRWKFVGAHRFAVELAVGKLPEGMQALHACDNRICVRFDPQSDSQHNPQHIFIGTNEINHLDKMKKNRQAKGEGAGIVVLTEEKVRTIRTRVANGETIVALAREFGVFHRTIYQIKHRHTWKHVL